MKEYLLRGTIKLFFVQSFLVKVNTSLASPLESILRIPANGNGFAEMEFRTATYSSQLLWTHDIFSVQPYQNSAAYFRANVSSQSIYGELPISTKGRIEAKRLQHNGLPEWYLWSLDTFDEGATSWSNHATSTCGGSSDIFLGGHCKFGGELTTQKTFTHLPLHTQMRITARTHFFDKWTGEALQLKLDAIPVWTRSYRWCDQILTSQCLKHGIDSCGTPFPDRLSVSVQIDVPHNSETATLEISSTLNNEQDSCDASWGIDDVAIYLKI